MSQNRQFTEVAGGSNNQTWKPQATEKNGMAYNPQGDNTREGYFCGEREVTSGEKPFTVANIQLMNPDGTLGEEIDVIMDTVLKDRLSKISMNAYVRLTYLGRTHKKGINTSFPWSQTNSFHNWWVGEDKGAIPLHTLTGRPAPTSQAPQTNPQTFGQGQPQFNPNAQQNMGQPQTFQPNFDPNAQQNMGQPGQNFQQQGNVGYQQPGMPPAQFGQPNMGQPVFPGGTQQNFQPNQGQPNMGQPAFNPNATVQNTTPNPNAVPYVAPVYTPPVMNQTAAPAYTPPAQNGQPAFNPNAQQMNNGQPAFNPAQGQPQMNANPNVFGGPQMNMNGNDDLPF
jgi:hypothetical protein